MFTTPQLDDYSTSLSPSIVLLTIFLIIASIFIIPRLVKNCVDVITTIMGVFLIAALVGLVSISGYAAVTQPKIDKTNKDMTQIVKSQGLTVVSSMKSDSHASGVKAEKGVQDFYGRYNNTVIECRIDNNGRTFSLECAPPNKTQYVPVKDAVEQVRRYDKKTLQNK